MYGSPFCFHTFTADQLDESDVVSCACGHRFKSVDLSEFAEIKKILEKSNLELSSLVKTMAEFNNSKSVVPAAATVAPTVIQTIAPPAPVKPPRPAKPKRERPPISSTQWLIIVAGVFIFIGAATFVGQSLNTWDTTGWSILESTLALATGFGAIRLKKFSELLSNFLAVFSSSLLTTLIMTVGTTFGWGFNAWNNEPAWFWCLNLSVVSAISIGLGIRFRNFGWRAFAPLALSAGSVVLLTREIGIWSNVVASIALFALLLVVRLARNAKDKIEGKSDEAKYLRDVAEREDAALKRFGIVASGILGIYALLLVLIGIPNAVATQFEPVPTAVFALVWLIGARLSDNLMSSILEKDSQRLFLRNFASGLGLTSLALSVLSLTDDWTVYVIEIALVALVVGLERYAKFLLLPEVSMSAAIGLSAVYAILRVELHAANIQALAIFLVVLGLLLLVRELAAPKVRRSLISVSVSVIGGLIFIGNLRTSAQDGFIYLIEFTAALIALNALVLFHLQLLKRAKVEISPALLRIPDVLTSVALLIAIVIPTGVTNLETLSPAYLVGYLALSILGSQLARKKAAIATALSNQSLIALGGLVLVVTWQTATNGYGALDRNLVYTSVAGLLLFGSAWLRRSKGFAIAGYVATLVNLLAAYTVWSVIPNKELGLGSTVSLAAAGALTLGSTWFLSKVSKDDAIVTGLTRVGLIVSMLIVELPLLVGASKDQTWLPLITLLLLALGVEFLTKRGESFIYLAGGLLLATASQTVVTDYSKMAFGLLTLAIVILRLARRTGLRAWASAFYVTAGLAGLATAGALSGKISIQWNGPELICLTVAAFLVVAAILVRKTEGVNLSVLSVDIPVLVVTLPSLVWVVAHYYDEDLQVRALLASGIIWAHNLWRLRKVGNSAWHLASFISGAFASVSLLANLGTWAYFVWAEPLPISIALAISVLVVAFVGNKRNTYLVVELPIAIALLPNLISSLATTYFSSQELWTITADLAVFWVLNLWRTRTLNESFRFTLSLINGALVAFVIGANAAGGTGSAWLPEVFSFSIALSVLATVFIAGPKAKHGNLLKVDIPVFIAVVPTLIAGVALFDSTRLLIAAALLWAHNYWRLTRSKSTTWLALSSVSGTVFALALSRYLQDQFHLDLGGPELYSLPLFAIALLQTNWAKRLKLTEKSLITSGLPLLVLLTPTAVQTWTDLSLTSAGQIARTVIFLLFSLGALLFGLRKGNLGVYLVGTFELWLVILPTFWFNTGVIVDQRFGNEFRGLIVAGFIFWLIALLRRYEILKVKSLIYVGLPALVALAPAVFNTLGSLGHDSLAPIDWWRFSIVLGVSLVLLVIGAITELGGAFYPGLIGVLVTVLPFAFTPTTNQQWFLWVILLSVAGLLIWLAVRLERLRKAGRDTSSWFKELK